MIAEGVAAGVHQPVIRVTDAPLVQSVKRIPGFPHVAQHHVNALVRVLRALINIIVQGSLAAFSFKIPRCLFLQRILVQAIVRLFE